jgi:protein gp37
MGSARYQKDGPAATSGPGFGVSQHPAALDQPLRWKRPRRIFVNSMSDLFHDEISDDFIAQVFAAMALAPQHTFQILTKRHGRMRSLLDNIGFRARVDTHAYEWAQRDPKVSAARESFRLPDGSIPPRWPLPNVWLGVSVENQQWADIRIPALLDTPAAVRFLSCEPLLGPVDIINSLGDSWMTGIDWVIVGGESGPGARPIHPGWARSLRDQCEVGGVAFHFKQWGEWAPMYNLRSEKAIPAGPKVRGEHLIHTDHGVIRMHQVGKKAAGRELDGRTWDEWPLEATHA